MGRRKILAGNWKMNKTRSEANEFFDLFLQKLKDHEEGTSMSPHRPEVLFAMPYTLLSTGQTRLGQTDIHVAAQNFHWADSGAYTGEVSALMLLDLGIKYTLIGHSERRQFFGESDESVAKKVRQALKNGLYPIVCVGETLEQREKGVTESVVKNQIQFIYKDLGEMNKEMLEKIVIAYEPVWAIGTGKASSSSDAQAVHHFIRLELSRIVQKDYAEKIRILYGGSASPKNIEELLRCPDIDGGLVGGASLNPDDFSKMVFAAYGHR